MPSCNKKKCRITPWQEKNKNPHSDLKHFKKNNKASLPH